MRPRPRRTADDAHPVRALLVVVAFACPASAEPKKWSAGPLAEPRQRLLKGNYEEARAAFEEAAKKDAKLAPGVRDRHQPDVPPGRRVRQGARGPDRRARSAADHPDLLAARADLLYELGRWDEAAKDADAAIAKEGRPVPRPLDRRRGSSATAATARRGRQRIRWFVRNYTARSNADNDIKDPDELLLVAQAGAENARWHNLADQFRFILNEVLADALKADPDLWPAEYLAGMLLLEKYNRGDADRRLRQGAEDQPEGRRGAGRQGPGRAAEVRAEGRRGVRRAGAEDQPAARRTRCG